MHSNFEQADYKKLYFIFVLIRNVKKVEKAYFIFPKIQN